MDSLLISCPLTIALAFVALLVWAHWMRQDKGALDRLAEFTAKIINMPFRVWRNAKLLWLFLKARGLILYIKIRYR
jgi:hypothetical protein